MITVTILTKNCAKYLSTVLTALQAFDEVLLLDSGSTDETFEIAARFPNVVIHRSPQFDGFGPMHVKAVALAKNDWILSVDSDEVVSSELAKEILQLKLNEKSVYTVPRHNFYNGRWIKSCGWYPDRAYRLFNRQLTNFNTALVHESVMHKNMPIVHLNGPLIHYSYEKTEDFLGKMQYYSTLFAEQNAGKKNSSVCKAVLHGLFTFFKSYILKRGILEGREGFVISIYNANTAFYKYLKLADRNREKV